MKLFLSKEHHFTDEICASPLSLCRDSCLLQSLIEQLGRQRKRPRYYSRHAYPRVAAVAPRRCYPKPIGTPVAVPATGDGDVLFGCVETLEVYIVDLITSAFLLSLFKVGVGHSGGMPHDISFDERST
ncbi:hypothetical protein [Methylosinus sp. KRF6]|uniref:hypothetical protein n=1 Tax=Methylosinus sp. KRF6 TaxID=2846853 RepID=UPI001C0DE63B|nr:hypothetical protein [Methylosinus sp. KRF6]MBU3888754.1 hypothetical protein [Methylosinus sp. KRF6]